MKKDQPLTNFLRNIFRFWIAFIVLGIFMLASLIGVIFAGDLKPIAILSISLFFWIWAGTEFSKISHFLRLLIIEIDEEAKRGKNNAKHQH